MPTLTRRISLIPFADSVNAGVRAKAVTGTSRSVCAFERGGSERFTDAPRPTPSNIGFIIENKVPCKPSRGLTTDSSHLKRMIDSLIAGGGTGGHIGLAWGWYSISQMESHLLRLV